MLKEALMKAHASIGDAVAWPFLLPGTLVCRAIGLSQNQDLVRMLVNSLFWTVIGVLVVVVALA
jgi:hypothetical protein